MSILEYKGEAIGLVGVDHQRPGENLESVIDGVKKEGKGFGWLKKKDEGQSVKDVASSATSSATDPKSTLKNRKQSVTVPSDPSGPISRKPNHLKGSTAHIRHLYVDAPYRGRGLEQDLLQFALSEAFDNSAIRRVIIATPSFASPALRSLLRSMSFVPVAQGDDAVVPGTPGHEEGQGIMVKDTREFGVAGWRVVGWSGKWLEITRGQWEAWKSKQRDE
jgi:predicted GNAT family acetyltransferase